MLGLSIDEPDTDEDVEITIADIPFIADKAFLEKNGNSYKIYFDENQNVTLAILAD